MIEYRCRSCGWWLFSSDAEHGKVEVTCSNRRCEKRQTIYLGERQPVVKQPRLQVVGA